MNRNCGALLLGAKMENVIHGFLFDFLTPRAIRVCLSAALSGL